MLSRPVRAVATSAVTAVVAATLLVGCTTSAEMPTPTPTPTIVPTGDGVLRIGTILPTSGTFAFLGAAQVAGVALAVKEINDAGGVSGVPVEVLHRDSGDAGGTKAEESLADLVSNEIDVVVGPSSSVLAERLIPLAAAEKVAMISPAATFPGLSSLFGGEYFFRTIPSYGRQGAVLGDVLTEGDPMKVAIIYISDDLGQALVPVLTERVESGGGEIVASVSVPVNAKDFAPYVAEVKESAPDAVVLSSAYSTLDATKALITQVVNAGFSGSKLWLTTQNTGDYSQALPAGSIKDVNGIIEGFQPDDAFIARLKGSDPNLIQFRYASEAFDATILAALAAVVAKDDAGQSVAATLQSVSVGGIKCTSFAECVDALKTQDDIDYDGVSGPVNITADGDVAPAFYGLYTFNAENKFVLARGLFGG